MSDENSASSSPPFGDPGFSPLRKTVKSYGISIDSSRIHEVAYEEQPETLRELGVNVFDQHVFEEGVYQQVDEAIAEQEALDYKKRLENELKTVEEDHRTGHKQQKSKLLIQDKHQKNEDHDFQRLGISGEGQDSHYEEETTELDEYEKSEISNEESSAEKLFRMGSQEETEVERLIRLGEMTPFGSKVDFKERMVVDDLTETGSGERDEKEPDQLKEDELLGSQVDKGGDGHDDHDSGGGDLTGGGEDGDFNFYDGHDAEGEGTSTSVLESDDEYIPDEEELKLSWEDDQVLDSEHDDVSAEEDYKEPMVKVKKVKKHKPLKKSTRLKHSTKDDGDDRLYQIRIRESKLKKVLRQKGIDYSGKSDEEDEDEFWNEEGLDEEFEGGLKIPALIWNKLFRFQKTGVKWLWELHCQQAGGIIGDEMGLGKTIQIIAFLAGLKYSNISRRKSNKQGGLGPVLIVCPATVLFQWVAEFHKWWPEFRVAVLHDTGSYQGPKDTLISKMRNSPGSILITTYSGVRLNQDHLLPCRWDYVILDEGHIIRNPDAEITLACKQFRTCHRIVLSGSPMQNNLRELWSLFDFVFPGKLGTLPVFMQEFSVPITMGGYANATSVQVQTAYKCACVLRDTINPYLLRRMKKDVKMKLDLPNKNEQVLFCRLTEEQTEVYKEYLASREVGSILSGTMKVFPGLIMLRKICNHPDLTTEAGSLWKLRKDEEQAETDQTSGEEMDGGYGYWKRSGKLVVVHSLLKLWKRQKHKVLLFTQTRQMLKILEIFVQSQGYNYSRMDGSTSIASRQPLIEKFNKDKSIFVFLLTTRVGGLGVNLIGANRVIIYDPDWNPGTDMQARERAWRVGQKKDVTIYRLLTTGTIEEKIYHRQIFKQFLTNRVLKDPKQRRFFKSNDLFELFTLDTSDGKKTGTETGAIFAGLGCEVKVPLGQKKGTKRKLVEPSNNASVLKMMKERTREILKTQFSSCKKPNTQTSENDSHTSEVRSMTEQSDSSSDARTSSDYTRHFPDDSDITSLETSSDRKISSDIPGDDHKSSDCTRDSSDNPGMMSKTCDREDPIKNTVSNVCDELPLSTDARITYRGSCDVTGTGSDREICDVDGTQTSVKDFPASKENELNIAPTNISPGADEGRTTKKLDPKSSAPLKKDKGKVKKKSKKKKKRNRIEGIRIGQLSHSEPYVAKKDGGDGDETRGGEDDHYILRKLFKKSGVHSALQHDTIVNSGNSDHLLVENEAQRVAAQAAEALRRSREQCMQLRTSGLPTWTGQSGFVGSPHGFAKKTMFGPKTKTKVRKEDSTMHFSGETLLEGKAGTDTEATSAEPMTSTQLLARMRARNFSGGNDAGGEVPSTDQKYQETLGEVRNFIATRCSRPGRATTREILEEFSSKLPVGDSAVFRAMLRKICDFDRGVSGEGYWVLKTEFSGPS